MNLPIAQQEELRQACLEFLVDRYPLAYMADAMNRMLARRQRIDFKVLDSDLVATLAFLRDKGMVERIMESIGVIPAWRATAEGVSYWQRKAVENNPDEGKLS